MVVANVVQKELLEGNAVDKTLKNSSLKAGVPQVVHSHRGTDPPFTCWKKMRRSNKDNEKLRVSNQGDIDLARDSLTVLIAESGKVFCTR
jgi:hypothetical protein